MAYLKMYGGQISSPDNKYWLIKNGVLVNGFAITNVLHSFDIAYPEAGIVRIGGGTTEWNYGRVTFNSDINDFTKLYAEISSSSGYTDQDCALGFSSSTSVSQSTMIQYFANENDYRVQSLTKANNATCIGLTIYNKRAMRIKNMWLE